MAYGLRLRANGGDRPFATQLTWLVEDFASDPPATLLPLSADAALLSGELRALGPTAPTGQRRRKGSKAEARVAWVLDIQIAVTAWLAGYDVATADTEHFQAIADRIAARLPDAPPLRVVPPPL